MEYFDFLDGIAEEVRQEVLRAIGAYKDLDAAMGYNPSDTLTYRIDLIAENSLIRAIEKSGVPTIVISEEIGEKKIGGDPPQIIIVADPLDGTINLLRGIPYYSVSLGLAKYQENPTLENMVAGLVKDIASGDTFHAIKGQGAYFNRLELRGPEKSFRDIVVSFYAYGQRIDPSYFKLCSKVKFRTLGSVALEVCYVAKGILDAYVDVRNAVRTIDVAAAKLILEEAGGILTDLGGRRIETKLDAKGKFSVIAAVNKEIHEFLRRELTNR
mgnify:FL=1